MWLILAFVSAFFLGCYDISKKTSVHGNAVIPILFLNTLFCSLLLLPLMLISRLAPSSLDGTIFFVPSLAIEMHFYILLKSIIVLSSWILGYFAIKHLPLSIVGPINATRPVMTLVGAMLIFGERLNFYQWVGVMLTIISFFLLSMSSKKEGIRFTNNRWIVFLFLATILGSASGLYDKFLMQRFNSTSVQFWFNFYQCLIMGIILLVLWFPKRKTTTPFVWRWSIVGVSVFLTIADFVYFYALSDPDSMISIVSMVRRSSVLISFAGAVLILHEKNLKAKALDMALIIIGMIFLYIGAS